MQGQIGSTPMGPAPAAPLPPPPPQFVSTDPLALAQAVAGFLEQILGADQAMFSATQQQAVAAADPLVQQLLGQVPPPMDPMMGMGAPMDPMMGYGEGALPPADPGMMGL